MRIFVKVVHLPGTVLVKIRDKDEKDGERHLMFIYFEYIKNVQSFKELGRSAQKSPEIIMIRIALSLEA